MQKFRNKSKGINKYSIPRTLFIFIVLLTVVLLGVKMNMETTQNHPDIKLISGIVAFGLLWPAYKPIDHFQKKNHDKKYKQ